ncbi:hypothetical protein [Hoeflea sp.]|uniref:hypothetical protein n=1 Tax=Hoeflea sp. TaxID=1940281 RepID=UPI003A8E4DB0
MKETETPPGWAGVLKRKEDGAAHWKMVIVRAGSRANRFKTPTLQTPDRAKLPLESRLFPAKTNT